MKFLFVLAFVFLAASAKPVEQTVAVTQDTAGNYKVDVRLDGQSKTEHRHADGTVSGSYSYVDANGELQTVEYTAGPDGFRATGSNIPVAPVDHNVPLGETEDVAKARALHLATFQQGLPNSA